MQLSCGGFKDCVKNNTTFTCDVSDSNYFFADCETLIIETGYGEKVAPIGEIIKDLHFEYTLKGKEVKGPPLSGNFVFCDDASTLNYWYKCSIKRPNDLTVNLNNPESSATSIRLVFTSKFNYRFQFFTNRSNIGNFKPTLMSKLLNSETTVS